VKEPDFSTQEGTIAAISDECRRQGLGLNDQVAYVLATTHWETAGTLRPVRESYFISKDFAGAEAWRKAHLRYWPYYGRGYVQLTWKENYQKYGGLLDIDLVGNPDLALEPQTACLILVHGFKHGTFTGRKLADFINADSTDFLNARKCINGLDHARDIAALAERYSHRTPKDLTPATYRLTQPMMRGKEIFRIQCRLNHFGCLENDQTDWIYGPITAAAVKKFQQIKRLPETGEADAATLTALGVKL
jgi:hypothetical protein